MSNPTDNEIPNEKWGSWALLKAYKKAATNHEKSNLADLIAERLEKTTVEFGGGFKVFLVYTSCGHWARGLTLGEAAKNVLGAGAKKKSSAAGFLVLNEETPCLGKYGDLLTEPEATTFNLGKLGTVGSILNANS